MRRKLIPYLYLVPVLATGFVYAGLAHVLPTRALDFAIDLGSPIFWIFDKAMPAGT